MSETATRSDAVAARDAAIALHGRKVATAEWLSLARAAARELCRRNGTATVNDVREMIGNPPPQADGRIMGAVFTRSEFEKVGEALSYRRVSHARPVARFKLRGA